MLQVGENLRAQLEGPVLDSVMVYKRVFHNQLTVLFGIGIDKLRKNWRAFIQIH